MILYVELQDLLSGQALLLISPAIAEDTKNISINVTKSANEIYGFWLSKYSPLHVTQFYYTNNISRIQY